MSSDLHCNLTLVEGVGYFMDPWQSFITCSIKNNENGQNKEGVRKRHTK